MTACTVPRPQRTVAILSFSVLFVVAALLSSFTAKLLFTDPLSILISWWNGTDVGDIKQTIFVFVHMPRVLLSILCGAALGLSGAIFQHFLRNPLAEPTTLGIFAGANLALSAGAVLFPSLAVLGQETIAFSGALILSGIISFLLFRREQSASDILIFGMMLTLVASSVSAIVTLLNREYLANVFIWQAGSLYQTNYNGALFVALMLFLTASLVIMLRNALSLGVLSNDVARGLGLPVEATRFIGLTMAGILAAAVVSVAGVIGFLGVAAPAIARLTGARTTGSILLRSALIGALLLWMTDQANLVFSHFVVEVPTGAVSALLYAPFLLFLAMRMRNRDLVPRPVSFPVHLSRGGAGTKPAFLLLGAALACIVFTLSVVWTAGGLAIDLSPNLLAWRWPRIVAVAAAGALLATSGLLLQCVSRNPMASPEVLGISGGATLGVVLAIFIWPAGGLFGAPIGFAFAGSLLSVAVALGLGARGGFAPDKVILLGVSLNVMTTTIVTILLATGDPRTMVLLTWIAGSSAGATAEMAIGSTLALVVVLAVALCLLRPIRLLSLDTGVARSLGVSIRPTNFAIYGCIAVAATFATATIGPLTFIGLMVPHLARGSGTLLGSNLFWRCALLGATVLVLADWCGRNVLYPWEIPAGILAALIGGPYFMISKLLSARTSQGGYLS